MKGRPSCFGNMPKPILSVSKVQFSVDYYRVVFDHFPSQSGIVLALENPPDLFGAIFCFVHEVPAAVFGVKAGGRFAGLGSAAVGSHVYYAAIGIRLKGNGAVGFTRIDTGTAYIIQHPDLARRVPSASFRFQMKVVIVWICKKWVGIDVALAGKATLNIAIGNQGSYLRARDLLSQISPDDRVRDCRDAV